ncbi:hypothetical protein [Pelodictyon phaeoclathratiforme]|jgi:hypothetical protein|uniref:NERD domain-containing protein n=1 Tax=Pelodictyon phaeoclathratiforme (strain DSM 5477 / BU-1) TaxID=324925 RepID=B4SE50_PELPB|nr:hypothetical protein [Pelodictyon phaeoclathratiforme]ACF44469.1 hypothetical protein Ppha_2274 [Pelodictyon phaeoclathratiforme BU-1]MBV5290443.1 hypothetical protein [Pelodictyon phaeoclathratiforme]
MDHFESIIATLLEAEGYWVRRSFKVNVTKEEKRQIGKHSIPRPEIDLLALHFSNNKVVALEAKSFLDSPGVKLAQLNEEHEVPQGRYKLFTSERYRKIVLSRLYQDLIACGMANSKTTISLGLAAGKVYQGKSEPIREFMEKRKWLFWSPEDIKQKVTSLADRGYENDPAIITAKILTR